MLICHTFSKIFVSLTPDSNLETSVGLQRLVFMGTV